MNEFSPRIVAYVCNWCTYLGADLAGTARLEYPPNVRIIRLPCTGRIDTNLVVKAFEIGADAVLVSGCHPGDCHYTAGNYHARRRWMLFRDLLDVVGFDMRRIHFTWISAAEGKRFQTVITEVTEQARALGPYRPYEAAGLAGESACPTNAGTHEACLTNAGTEQTCPTNGMQEAVGGAGGSACESPSPAQTRLRETAARLLSDVTVKVVIGYGERGPAFITRPEDAARLVWNETCFANLTAYLKRRSATDWKPIPFVGTGVIEIRVHAEGEYRVFYVAKFEDAVYVLHVFAKKTRKASSLDVELGKKRYRELLERRK